MTNKLISKAVEYCPDWLFAEVYTRYNKRGIKIKRNHSGWEMKGDGFSLLSSTSKFTSASMKEFEDKFERYFKIGKGDTCLDVGACIGDTTIPMCIKTGKGGFVYVVEPNHSNVRYLQFNLDEFKNTKIFELAVWKEKGHLIFHEHHTPTGHSLIPLSLRKKKTIVVTNTIDELFKGIVFDYAKIDVQSAEVEVLQGATEFLKTTRKLIVGCHHSYKNELHDTSDEVKQIISKYYSNMEYLKEYNHVYAWR